jgi:hypothetical protein
VVAILEIVGKLKWVMVFEIVVNQVEGKRIPEVRKALRGLFLVMGNTCQG